MKKLWATILTFFKWNAFAKVDGKYALTEDQRRQMTEAFGEDFTKKFESDMAKETDDAEPPAGEGNPPGTPPADPPAGDNPELATATQNLVQAQQELGTMKTTLGTTQQQLTAANAKVTALQDLVSKLSAGAETDPKPSGVPAPGTKLDAMNDKFLFGIQQPYMAIDKSRPYNLRAYASLMASRGHQVIMPEASSFDYTQLKNDLGDYYRVRKQEQIQSFLATLPSLEKIFPLESGYQDRAVLVNVFMDEFSQADNTVGSNFDNVVKGSYLFQPEEIRMYDVMFAHKFSDLKTLEKNWLGYLNREGSSTMKWSFIEYILSETAKKLHNEREVRRINGVRKNPTVNVPGVALEASNGLREFIRTQLAAFKLRPFAIGEWNDSNIASYVYAATAMVPEVWRDTGRVVLYMSTDALSKYNKNRESLYGGNIDYKADIMYVAEFPNVRIEPVHGLAPSKRMIWSLDGNIKTFEDKPNEMTAFNLEQQDWTLKVWSNWKESIWAYMVGRKYDSLAQIPTDYSTQLIWTNDVDLPEGYYLNMEVDDTTPSVLRHNFIQSVANTQATAITNIDDAVVGQEITLKCNNATNAITIAQAGNFSLISAAWEPDLGDTITLMKRSDGKFIEVARNSATTDAIVIAADDATPDVSEGSVFVTSANSAATAITDLDNSVYDVIYTIYGGSDDDSSTIANAGNFVLTAAMTLDEGSYIKLIKSRVDDKFYEIERG